MGDAVMRAILINPDTRTITEIETKGDLNAMHGALTRPGCARNDDINAVRITPHDDLWVDGEGLLKPDVPVFRLRGYHHPLAGRGLILGNDGYGKSIGTKIAIERLHDIIQWTDQFTTGELTPTIEEPGHIKLGDGILKTITVPGPDKIT
jgi:hypothetical protein